MNGDINTTSKSDMPDILVANFKILDLVPSPDLYEKTCLLIDGHALIRSIGKPHNITFEGFLQRNHHFDESVQQVDILFDTYIESWMKAAARARRSINRRPIRKIVDLTDLSLPQVYTNIIALPEDKADLANFLSVYLITYRSDVPYNCGLVTSDGFQDTSKAYSTNTGGMTHILGNHEEADTRIVLHTCDAVRNTFNRLLVVC